MSLLSHRQFRKGVEKIYPEERSSSDCSWILSEPGRDPAAGADRSGWKSDRKRSIAREDQSSLLPSTPSWTMKCEPKDFKKLFKSSTQIGFRRKVVAPAS